VLVHGRGLVPTFPFSPPRPKRPRPPLLAYSWHTALLGSIWCLGLMFVINWIISLVFLAAHLMMVLYISHAAAKKDWGDAVSGLMFQQVAG